MFILKPHSGVPIYRQLLDQIRRMVASGQLPPGTSLPSIRELALQHAINPMTVSKAYSLLEAEGLLERNRGKPMTIAREARTQSAAGKRLQQLEAHLEQLVLAARQLELSETDVIKALKHQWERTHD
jgi:GntR family transcriptional regulator